MLFLCMASILIASLTVKLSTNDHDSFYFLIPRLFEFMFGSVAAIFLLLIDNRTKNISPYFLDGIAFISVATVLLTLLTPNFFRNFKGEPDFGCKHWYSLVYYLES